MLAGKDFEWSKVTAALVDERWVPSDADASNERFIRKSLVQGKAAPLNFIGLYNGATEPQSGLQETLCRFEALHFPLDVAVLGMGPDGHTASWFPHAEGLNAALSLEGGALAAITAERSEVTSDHVMRMTMTLRAIASARFICLLIAGAEKRQTLDRALEKGDVSDMPIRALLQARPDLWICWAP
jgi:6-phosphogluconolactonase